MWWGAQYVRGGRPPCTPCSFPCWQPGPVALVLAGLPLVGVVLAGPHPAGVIACGGWRRCGLHIRWGPGWGLRQGCSGVAPARAGA